MQKKKWRFPKYAIPTLIAFVLVACALPLTSDSGIPIQAVYLVQGEGQLTQNDLKSHPEVLVTNSFDDFKKFARSKVSLWIDINASGLVDREWLSEKPQKFYPVVLVGNGDELCSFMVTLWYIPLEGPGGYECNPPPPGFSVNMMVSETDGNMHGYNESPTVQGILDITNPLLEGSQ